MTRLERLAAACGVATNTVPEAWEMLLHGNALIRAGSCWANMEFFPRALTCGSLCAPFVGSAPELWEALVARDLVPMTWGSDPARRFYEADEAVCHCGETADRHGYSDHSFTPLDTLDESLADAPEGYAAVLAVAAMLPEMVTAEALAREALPGLREVLWHLGSRPFGGGGTGPAHDAIRRMGFCLTGNWSPGQALLYAPSLAGCLASIELA